MKLGQTLIRFHFGFIAMSISAVGAWAGEMAQKPLDNRGCSGTTSESLKFSLPSAALTLAPGQRLDHTKAILNELDRQSPQLEAVFDHLLDGAELSNVLLRKKLKKFCLDQVSLLVVNPKN